MTPKITYIHDIEFELRKVVMTLDQIKAGFYQERNYYQTLSIPENFNIRQRGYIHLLNSELFSYAKDHFAWSKLNEDREAFLMYSDISKYNELVPYLNFKKIECPWDLDKFKKCVKVLTDFFDVEVKNIEICMTSFGTMGAFTILSKDPLEFRLYPRFDLPDLIRSFTAILIRAVYPNRPWVEYQSLQDFLVDKTIIKKLSKTNFMVSSKPTYIPPKVIKQSNQYFAELGFPVNPSLRTKYGQISLSGYGDVDFLTPIEEKALRLLLENKGTTLNSIEFMDLLWKDSDKGSLQALTKIIERVRGKLKLFGLQKQVIHTSRGRGYYLSE